MKIFFDTNFYISAFISDGVCKRIYQETLGEHEIFASKFLLEEFEGKLIRKFKIDKAPAKIAVNKIRKAAKLVEYQLREFAIKDKDDFAILSAAITANCDYLVTGDKELVELGEIKEMKILLPRDFINILKK